MEHDEEYGGQVREEAKNSKFLSEVDFKKLWSEIRHFKEHFTMKGFFLGLFLGLIPSGWDTFSDFAFAADDHNRTIELINATDQFIYKTHLENRTNVTLTSKRSLFLADQRLDERTIRTVTYFCISIPALVTIVEYILKFNIKWCGSCAYNCLKFFAIVVVWMSVVRALSSNSPIYFGLALISSLSVLTVKVLELFVHGPEMKKISLKATMAESSNESAGQLMFVIIVSLWAKEVTATGLMSMLSSIIMIGKSSTESYLSFGSKNLLRDASLGRQFFLFAITSPVFILTAIFRIGSFSLICA